MNHIYSFLSLHVFPKDSPVSADGFQPASSLTDGRVNLLSVVPFKQSTVSSIVSKKHFYQELHLLQIVSYKFGSDPVLCHLFTSCGPRTWACPPPGVEVGVKTHPAITFTRTDTNLKCVQNVAAS